MLALSRLKPKLLCINALIEASVCFEVRFSDFELIFKASLNTSTNGPLPERYTLNSDSSLSKLFATTSNPTSVFPAPGTPVTKQIYFLFSFLAFFIKFVISFSHASISS